MSFGSTIRVNHFGDGQFAFFEAVDASGAIRSRVLWSVQEGPVGGSISDAGQYFAPTSAGIYHLIATNPDNPGETASATITVVSGGGGIGGTSQGLSIWPDQAEIPAGTYQSLSIGVVGLDDQTVTWTVENSPNTASVNASGVFKATQPGAYRVFARSTANTVLNGSSVITVVPSVTLIPGAPSLQSLLGYTVTALSDGRILITGGTDGATYFRSARIFDPEINAFTDLPPMLAPRAYHTATLLADGRVLLAGGVGDRDEFGGLVANAWAEVFNPVTNAFEALPESPTPNEGTRAGYMRSPHATAGFLDTLETDGHGQSVSARLGNGQVLIAGGPMVNGYSDFGSFDQLSQRRMTDVFTPGPDTFDVSNWVGYEALDDVQGWALTANAEISRKGVQMVALDDGTALLTGGLIEPYADCNTCPPPSTEDLLFPEARIFNGSAFGNAARMNEPRAYHTLTKLQDGKVLVVGGYKAANLDPDFMTNLVWHRVSTATAELYDPATGAFTFVGNLYEPRARHAAVLLPTGQVLIVGGKWEYGDGRVTWPKTTELYDPETGTFSVMDHLEYGLEEPKLALMRNGELFVAGQMINPIEATLAPKGKSFNRQTSNYLSLFGGIARLAAESGVPGKLAPFNQVPYNFSNLLYGVTFNVEFFGLHLPEFNLAKFNYSQPNADAFTAYFEEGTITPSFLIDPNNGRVRPYWVTPNGPSFIPNCKISLKVFLCIDDKPNEFEWNKVHENLHVKVWSGFAHEMSDLLYNMPKEFNDESSANFYFINIFTPTQREIIERERGRHTTLEFWSLMGINWKWWW